jgi:hypothetical protein
MELAVTTADTSFAGHLEVLKHLFTQRTAEFGAYVTGTAVLQAAARRGRLDYLQWARSTGKACNLRQGNLIAAALSTGQHGVAAWLYSCGCPCTLLERARMMVRGHAWASNTASAGQLNDSSHPQAEAANDESLSAPDAVRLVRL